MSARHKLRNRIQIARGHANVWLGRLTGNRSRQAKGHKQRLGGTIRQAGERVKDASQTLRVAFRRS
jgi:uncharacterized protein YjbJ (UPF0337 family)